MYELGPPSPAAAHARALDTTDWPHVRWNSTHAIGQCGAEAGDVGVDALARTVVHKDSENYLRWQASQSIALLGSSTGHKTQHSLAQCLLQRKPGQPGAEVFVRCSVAGALGQLGEDAGEVGVRALSRALETESSDVVRQRAASSLGQLGELAGDVGIKSLVKALGRRDEELNVKLRTIEALGQIGARIGDAGALALAKALVTDKEDGVRLKAAASLGALKDVAGDKGVQALLQAMRKDHRMAVREQSERSLASLEVSCAETLDEVSGNTHVFSRGRSAHILGLLRPMIGPRAVEVLCVNVVNDWDVYLRRRAVEAFDKLGSATGDLGVAALSRAAASDEDVYVQWVASQALGSLGQQVQPAADERLGVLLEEDLKRRPPPPSKEEPKEEPPPALVVVEEPAPVEAPPPLPPPEEEPKVEEPPKEVVVREADIREASGGLGKIHGLVAFDEAKAEAAFAQFAQQGEVSAEPAKLEMMLKLVGHQNVDTTILDKIVSRDLSGRNFLDKEDFMAFIRAYETLRLELLHERFRETDTDGSGLLSAEELAALLRRMCITPGTGVVAEIIFEVCGSRTAEVSFEKYIAIHTILSERSGFTIKQYARLQGVFNAHDEDKDGRISITELRSCFAWQGFRLSQEDVQRLAEEAAAARAALEGPLPEGSPLIGLISEVEFLRVSRQVREEEAMRVLKEVADEDEDEEGAGDTVNVIEGDELPDLLLDLGNAPLLPEHVKEFMHQCGYLSTSRLVFEDLIPLLEKIREAEGFSQSELEDIDRVFKKYDADGSGSVSGLELERAINSLGFPASWDTVQGFLETFDIDNTGELDDREFLQLMGTLRKAEIDRSVAHVTDVSSAVDFNEDGIAVVPASELPQVLTALGYIPLREDSEVLKKAAGLEELVTHWGLARLIGEYRAEQYEVMQKWRGFTEAQVKELRHEFAEYDPERTGCIEGKHLRDLLGKLFAGARNDSAAHARVAEIVKSVDADGSGTIDFFEFLGLMREVRDDASKEKLEKERRAVQATGFSRTELKEFREVFHMFDADGSGDMEFDELQQMCAILVGGAASGHKGETELREVLEASDQDGGGQLDFPEFLHVIRALVDRNWCGITDKLGAASGGQQAGD